jgi:hypothetical protein
MAKTEFSIHEAKAFFSLFYGGEHHFPNEIKQHGLGWSMVDKYKDFATYDGNELTRLVVTAHDFCMRVSLVPVAGPNPRMKICVWKRERDGDIGQRHPNLEDHAESIRKGYNAYIDKNPDELGILRGKAQKRETPQSIRAAGHVFRRYLMENPYAEEMKCSCGFVIWPCWTEEEVESAIKQLNQGVVKECPNSYKRAADQKK